jgi:Domain of unknown function (DUF4386)
MTPQFKARMAGFCWLMTFAFGIGSMMLRTRSIKDILANELAFRGSAAANILATCAYVGVTLLIYEVFRHAGRITALLGVFCSLIGCAMGVMSSVTDMGALFVLQNDSAALVPVFKKLSALTNNSGLFFFGFHCFTTGLLILRSGYVARAIGILMLIAGIGWWTFIWPPLTEMLFPYIILPGMIGELSLTLWLLIKGVNVPQGGTQ